VTVLDATAPASGASGAAAGLFNPFAGQRANPGWRFAEAIATLEEAADRAGAAHLLRQRGILRPATTARQAGDFRQRAAEHPDELAWMDAEAVAERHPEVRASRGALWVRRGGAIDLPTLVRALLAGIDVRAGVRVTAVDEDADGVRLETEAHGRFAASRVVLAPGAGFPLLLPLAALPLGRVKGQTIRVRPVRPIRLPLLAGYGYAVPEQDGTVVLGSTYEHEFDDLLPGEAASREILERAVKTVPGLEGAAVIESRAGVRVTVPTTVSRRRLPRVGPVAGDRLWAIVGLGSRGLMTAPLLARDLPRWLADPALIDPELRLWIGN
jgi:glycine/D-amino acid oxidase-like deaminating enzyme